MLIRKAERKKAKLRLGISGISGSGKTWSALEIAKGMGGKIGMIDTEAGRGELYGNNFDYDIIRLDAPYSPDRYIEAIKAFEKAGYDILIIDSLSHAWVGEGGVLSIVDRAGADKFGSGWKTATPMQNHLVDTIINSKMHIIATLRVKSEYVVEVNSKGKNAPRKVGMAPVQRDGLEYEFTVFMDMNNDGNIAHVTKDNTNMYNQQYLKPSPDMGAKLMEWLNTGIDAKDHFKTVVIPQLIDSISACKDEIELKDVYAKAWRSHQAMYPDEFKVVTNAYQRRKTAQNDSEHLGEAQKAGAM